MKKKLLSVLLAAAMLLTCIPLGAVVSADGDFSLYVGNNGEGILYGYTGAGGDVIIPSVLKGYSVTTIDSSAFSRNNNITSIEIPDSVTFIEEGAFEWCSNLSKVMIGSGVATIGDFAFGSCEKMTEIIVDDSNPYFSSEDGVLFNKEKNRLIRYPEGKIGSYTIPDCVTVVEDYAFIKGALTSVTIPSNITDISEGAFEDCKNLMFVTIPDSVTTIGEQAFSYCTNLTTIDLPNSITSIGGNAFFGSGLTSITVPKNITTIKYGTFGECRNLSSISIPEGVTTIEDSAFWRCAATEINIPNTVTEIGPIAFGESDLVSVYIPENVVYLSSAFHDCVNLTSYTVEPDNPSYCSRDGVLFTKDMKTLLAYPIGNERKSYRIPDGVTTIAEDSFYYVKLTSLIIPKSIQVIESAFWETAITDIYYCGSEADRANIKENYFLGATWHYNYGAPLTITTQPKTVNYAKDGATVKVTVKASGYGLKYTWYVKNDGASKYTKSSITSATYSVKMGDKVHGRQVYCVVTDKNGNKVQTNTATLRRQATITAQPAATAYAQTGKKVSVKISAKGDGLKYTWYFKNSGSDKYTKSSITSSTYSATMGGKVKNRKVYCVVKDKYGKTVQSKTFTLRELVSITAQSAATVYAKKGAKATVKVTAKGDGLKYTWYYKNSGSSKYTKSSITSATYSATMGSKVKNRKVYCVVKDKYGKTVQSKTFTLRESVSIVTQPKTVTVKKNATAKVTVKASGDGLKYTWYIKNAGSGKYSKTSVKTASYAVKMTNKVKNRQVYCVVTDKYGKTVKTVTVKLKMK